MSNIYLNKEIKINIEKLVQSRMVILANSGGGKSYAIRKIAEESVDQIQTIIIDPEGEFASLREKYDFILAGKGADVPVEVRSAALLATKLLELGKSAVIDLYELHPQERQRYVKLFCESLINCPKELYHPVIIILDEAHEYVPEGKPSEATWAVEALASKGRKRGFCLIPASQRIAKLSKNVSAECNNKLIGRASQDIDMKRAGDELGFSKEKLVQLRQLKPGEFFAFGTAISDDVIKITIGSVKTTHAKVGYKNTNKVPPPSHVIKKVLGELLDLPQEAEKEAKTIADLKKENTELKRMNTNLLKNPFQKDLTDEEIKKITALAITARDKEWEKIVTQWANYVRETRKHISDAESELAWQPELPPVNLENLKIPFLQVKTKMVVRNLGATKIQINPPKINAYDLPTDYGSPITIVESKPLRAGAMKMLNWLAGASPESLTKQRLATLSGFAVSGGTFNTYISELKRNGWIEGGDVLTITNSGMDNADPENMPSGEDLLILWINKFRAGAGNILRYVYDRKSTTKEEIGQALGFEVSGGTFNTYLSELRRNGLIEVKGNTVEISEEFY